MGISMEDSKLVELARLISEWHGLTSRPAAELIDDSLVLLEHLGEGQKVVDVGSGGGLPGLPLKIARPDLSLTLVKVGGRLLAQKTESEELSAAGHAIEAMGGALRSVVAAPSAARGTGTVVVVDKVRSTPAAYPRRPGVP